MWELRGSGGGWRRTLWRGLPCSAVKDVYLPQSRVWLADYPFIDRGAFLSVLGSLERG